jgi:hypothetical protein
LGSGGGQARENYYLVEQPQQVVRRAWPERERSSAKSARNLSGPQGVRHAFLIFTSPAHLKYSSELDGLRHELEQSKKVRSTVKRIVFRKDMGRRVKQCDGKLSNLLQTFEVCHWHVVYFTGKTHRPQIALAIDARLEQIKINKNSCQRRMRPS